MGILYAFQSLFRRGLEQSYCRPVNRLSEARYLADIADEFWVMADDEIRHKYTSGDAKTLSQEQLRALCLRTLNQENTTKCEKYRTIFVRITDCR